MKKDRFYPDYDITNDENFDALFRVKIKYLSPDNLIRLYVYSQSGNDDVDYIPEYIFKAINDIPIILKAVETKRNNDQSYNLP
ncbi:MAG: hypothetical protein ACK5AY_03425 [Bacteroidota bacterium]